MIKRIDIEKFGVYNNSRMPSGSEFTAINIIYGRNYSGKTTLSRLVRLLETRDLGTGDELPRFQCLTHQGVNITQSNFTDTNVNDLNICVYNRDFVRKNISWMHDDNGDVKPFTIVGATNIQIEADIKQIDLELGSIETRGKYFDKNKIDDQINQLDKSISDKDKKIKLKLSEFANNNIKLNDKYFKAGVDGRSFSITEVDRMIPHVNNFNYSGRSLQDLELDAGLATKDFHDLFVDSSQRIGIFVQDLSNLLKETIEVRNKISELLDDPALSEWVYRGIKIHENSKDSCKFCGNTIYESQWQSLVNHFDEEYGRKVMALDDLSERVSRFSQQFLLVSLNEDRLFTENSATIKSCYTDLNKIVSEIKTHVLNVLQTHVSEKKLKMATRLTLEENFEEYIQSYRDALSELNSELNKNNNINSQVSIKSKNAREELRYIKLKELLEAIDYSQHLLEVESKNEAIKDLKVRQENLRLEITQLGNQRTQLELSRQDESAGANLINKYLSDFFGYKNIRMVAVSDSSNVKFSITRDGQLAKNLSDGECSLISFCYYVAYVKEKLNVNSGRNVVVYIDDPISSLDSSHVYFVFSIIDAVISTSPSLKQLFISTHNLDFLKYLKRLNPKNLTDLTSAQLSADQVASAYVKSTYFSVVRYQRSEVAKSLLEVMPSYLEDYATEYNYLFNQVYNLAKDTYPGDKQRFFQNTFTTQYSFANNARKFLEIYLFFRFPSTKDPLDHLSTVMTPEDASKVNRVVNEYSHLTTIERAIRPVEFDEIETCAKLIMSLVKDHDEEQYKQLVSTCK